MRAPAPTPGVFFDNSLEVQDHTYYIALKKSGTGYGCSAEGSLRGFGKVFGKGVARALIPGTDLLACALACAGVRRRFGRLK